LNEPDYLCDNRSKEEKAEDEAEAKRRAAEEQKRRTEEARLRVEEARRQARVEEARRQARYEDQRHGQRRADTVSPGEDDGEDDADEDAAVFPASQNGTESTYVVDGPAKETDSLEAAPLREKESGGVLGRNMLEEFASRFGRNMPPEEQTVAHLRMRLVEDRRAAERRRVEEQHRRALMEERAVLQAFPDARIMHRIVHADPDAAAHAYQPDLSPSLNPHLKPGRNTRDSFFPFYPPHHGRAEPAKTQIVSAGCQIPTPPKNLSKSAKQDLMDRFRRVVLESRRNLCEK
jgi:hypothetical protein